MRRNAVAALCTTALILGLSTADASAAPFGYVDGPSVRRLLLRAARRVPSGADELGIILHGIGECAARCHADLLGPLLTQPAPRERRLPTRVLETAFAISRLFPHRIELEDHGAAQMLLEAKLAWDTLQYAVTFTANPHRAGRGGRFGFAFVLKLFARSNPAALDRWLRSHKVPDPSLAAVVSSLAEDLVWQGETEALARSLLRLTNPLVRSLGAAATLYHPFRSTPPHDCARCFEIFTAGGIGAADAIWMVSLRLKDAVHARYRCTDQLLKLQARRRYVEASREAAVGGAHNGAAECDRLRRDEIAAEDDLKQAENAIEQALDQIAVSWPRGGLDPEQMIWLDNAFVGTAEVRHRLGVKLPDMPNRTALFDANIRQLAAAVGISEKAPAVFDQHLVGDQQRLAPLFWWSAQSHCERYRQDSRGIGRRASFFLRPITVAGEAILDQPFLASRQYIRWTSAVARLACCHLWALLVVAATPAADAAQVTGLRDLALDHTRLLLQHGRDDFRDDSGLYGWLIRTAARFLSDETASEWAFDDKLPATARVFAIWSAPALVAKYPSLAFELLCCLAQKPLSTHANDRQVNLLVTLVDWAIPRAAKSECSDYLPVLQRAWAACCDIWPEVLRDELAELPRWLWDALHEEGEARQRLLADRRFAASQCVAQLKGDVIK